MFYSSVDVGYKAYLETVVFEYRSLPSSLQANACAVPITFL